MGNGGSVPTSDTDIAGIGSFPPNRWIANGMFWLVKRIPDLSQGKIGKLINAPFAGQQRRHAEHWENEFKKVHEQDIEIAAKEFFDGIDKDKDGKLMAMSVSIGETVLLPEYGASMIKLGDEEFHLIKDMDILGKLEG